MRIFPEVNVAKTLVRKHSLAPPIDVHALVSQYATVEEIPFPADVDADGISINIKVSGKHPRVIINSTIGWRRKRFTLAHELGHILIPWHFGTIIDVTKIEHAYDEYSQGESEASRFAAELLMPSEWVISKLSATDNPATFINEIVEGADVSSLAATITAINLLPTGFIFASLDQTNTVVMAGRSRDTLANAPDWGKKLREPAAKYQFCEAYSEFCVDGNRFCWWKMPTEVKPQITVPDVEWRSLLDEIVEDLELYGDEGRQIKSSLNGCIAFANGAVKSSRTRGAVYAACLQRLQCKPQFASILEHPQFSVFLSKKVEDLVAK